MVSGAPLCRRSALFSRLKRAGVKLDYIGIALLALGIGALQVLLDKGQEDDWFGSHFITTLVVVATVCLIFTGYLGVVSQSADHRRPHVQELQLRQRELDDVHLGNLVVQQPGRLGYSVHTKALNAFQYIPPFSFHEPSVARGWI